MDIAAETQNPGNADDAIEVAVAQLREKTRTEEFPLVLAENRDYNFQRNLYGLRGFSRLVSGVCSLLLGVALAGQSLTHGHAFQAGAVIAGLIIDVCLFAMWLTLPKSEQVKQAGDKYAHQLLQAAVTLQAGQGPGTAA
jgi:hypothetical protein